MYYSMAILEPKSCSIVTTIILGLCCFVVLLLSSLKSRVLYLAIINYEKSIPINKMAVIVYYNASPAPAGKFHISAYKYARWTGAQGGE